MKIYIKINTLKLRSQTLNHFMLPDVRTVTETIHRYEVGLKQLDIKIKYPIRFTDMQ